MDEQRQDDPLEPINNSSELIQDIARKTFQEQWTIEMDDKRESGDPCWWYDMMMISLCPSS